MVMGLSTTGAEAETHYSWQIAFIYVFNLIVGAGALTLPKAFAQTGWILGMVALAILALMSYCTSTFMVEAMSIANGVTRLKARRRNGNASGGYGSIAEVDAAGDDIAGDDIAKDDDNDACSDEGAESPTDIEPILHSDSFLYEIATKVEMGEMAKLFFHKIGLILYYIVISLYLYGDLAIYAAAVPKSMTTTICGDTKIFDHDVTVPCGHVSNIRVIDMYRIMLVVFVAALGPFAFFNIGKTKFLQIFTTIFRWISFTAMVVLALIKIIRHKGHPKAEWFHIGKLPNFFGVAVYSFMCQHSLPSILTPVRNKKHINWVILTDFVSIASFYALVALTAVFAFPEEEIQDLYTLNFTSPIFFKYFLELFPVFTLSTSFPIIAITLRENLRTLFLRKGGEYGLFVRRFLFPLITIIPPIAIAYCTYDVGMLVSITGTYAGAIIQYIVPVMLVYCGRREIKKRLGVYVNKHRSPFRHNFWIYFVVVWYVMCFVFVTVNMAREN